MKTDGFAMLLPGFINSRNVHGFIAVRGNDVFLCFLGTDSYRGVSQEGNTRVDNGIFIKTMK